MHEDHPHTHDHPNVPQRHSEHHDHSGGLHHGHSHSVVDPSIASIAREGWQAIRGQTCCAD
jgi:hypothetical protein